MEMQNPVTISPSALALGGALQKRKLLHPYQGSQQQHRAAEQQHGAAEQEHGAAERGHSSRAAPGEHPQAAPQSLRPPGHDGSRGTAGAPGTRSTAGTRSRRPGAPGEAAAAPRGHRPSPPPARCHQGSGLAVRSPPQPDGCRGTTTSAPAPPLPRPSFPRCSPARWLPAPPGRTCCPPPPSPGPAAHTKAAARPARLSHRQHRGLRHLLQRPRWSSPGMLRGKRAAAGRVQGGTRGHTDTDAAVAQLRAAAQPRPRRARAGTLLLGGRSPLTPSRSPCRPHSPRPHRARPGADRARRPPTRTEPAAPPPPAACSLPLIPYRR